MLTIKFLALIILEFVLWRPVLSWKHVPTRKMFWQIVDREEPVLVAFVAPWTEPSRALEPEWLKLMETTHATVMSVNCEELTRMCRKNGVFTYPAIRLYIGDENIIRYRGPRTAAGMISFLERTKLEVVSSLDTLSTAQFQSIDDSVFIAYLGNPHKEERKSFTLLAERHHNRFSFGISSATDLPDRMAVRVPSVVYYSKEHGISRTFTGVWMIQELEKFMEVSATNVIREFTNRTDFELLSGRNSLVYVFVQNESERQQFRAALRPVALKYHQLLRFVTIDARNYAEKGASLGISKYPAVRLEVPSDGRVYSLGDEKAINETTVNDFISGILEGTVKPTIGHIEEEVYAHSDSEKKPHDEL